MNLGTGPVFTVYLGVPTNATVAASMAGTAAATQLIASASFTYARAMEIFNLTARNLEVIIGNDIGTTAYSATTIAGTVITYSKGAGQSTFFVPGTASATVAGRANRFAIEVQQGMNLWVRTTENTPITASSTSPLIINFWA